MPTGAAHNGPHFAAMFLQHLNGIEGAPREMQREAAKLTQRVTHILEQSGMFFDKVARSVAVSYLFIAHNCQDHIAGRDDILSPGAQESAQHHHDAALHIQCAASPDVAIMNFTAERLMLPALVGGGDDIDMPLQ